MKFLRALLVALLLGWPLSAVGEPVATKPSPADVEFFEKQVRPLLHKHCVSCHGPESQEAGLRLDSRDGMLKGTEGHPVVVPGAPEKSRLIAVTRYDGDVQMPPEGKLPEKEYATLVAWIKMGMPWPADEGPAATTASANKKPAPAEAGYGDLESRYAAHRAAHWAYQPIRRPELPAVKDEKWAATPVDRFVLARLESAGLRPSPPADRRTLLRRVSYDLIGLPPSFDELEAFAHDPAPDAYARAVERLLASPAYGERWARHWLDVARYADTRGYSFQEETRYPFAYTYRDYVIRALNEDKPFDRFVLEQLAADQLPHGDDNSTLAALGFLTVGSRFMGNTFDQIDDRIDVVTRGLMGLTVTCARCHDHKFDAVPTADYYSLYGVFKACTEPEEPPLVGQPQDGPEYQKFKTELAKLEAEERAFIDKELADLEAELRTQAGSYLGQAVLDKLDRSTENDVFFVFEKGDSRPAIIKKWRDYLAASAKSREAVFAAWHRFAALPKDGFAAKAPQVLTALADEAQLAPAKQSNRLVREALLRERPQEMADVVRVYGKLLADVNAQWAASQASTDKAQPRPERLPDTAAEQLRQVLYAESSPTHVRREECERLFDRKTRDAARKLRKKVETLTVTSPGAPPRAMVVQDMPQPPQAFVLVRGNPGRRGADVPRQFLRVLAGEQRKPFEHGSGRLDLAQAIVANDNPLTARVLVNRVWMQHFGAPLVSTPSDFGIRCDQPTHPELLDYLAATFRDEGWSLKKLHRSMVLSNAYQQASDDRPDGRRVDADNRLLWRMNRRRLEFEAMRDSLLVAAGRLDTKLAGRPVDIAQEPFTTRRTVYAFIRREDLPGLFATFDFPNPDVSNEARPRTTVPQQALFGMNAPFVMEQARYLAARAKTQAGADIGPQIVAVYRLALGREPRADEAALASKFLEAAAKRAPPADTWQYGVGEIDLASRTVRSFTRLKHWQKGIWQAGPKMPDPAMAFASLSAEGGHTGGDARRATILRWTAPRDGAVALAGVLEHPAAQGDGVRLTAVSSRAGSVGQWTVHHGKKSITVDRIAVQRGDTIDLVVDCLGNDSFDSFRWQPEIRLLDTATKVVWNARRDFHGPGPAPMSPWEQLAQVVLLTNEFAFVD